MLNIVVGNPGSAVKRIEYRNFPVLEQVGFINPIEVVPRYLHYIYRPLHAYLRVGDFFIF
ncbi:hypothetical protein EXW45_07405 [Bacillus wiedmannii]|nr:hypothetical protein DT250_19080 [Bacillus sp. AR2-1]KAA0790324.1 hypothetical protein DN394_11350 [Bacillus sp. BB081]MBE7094515.1 hypothetical protein [Bacillus cereus]QWH65580.1 hypothetical protein EXW41_07120 [Bacillus wiedmannii]QWH71213.1 hypothetical protein EXW45_07405 [Bacillus wiedmannii]